VRRNQNRKREFIEADDFREAADDRGEIVKVIANLSAPACPDCRNGQIRCHDMKTSAVPESGRGNMTGAGKSVQHQAVSGIRRASLTV